MTYRELKAALELFALGERATLKQVKARHRELVKLHHPDQGDDGEADSMSKINAAYAILSVYCENYQFCFSEEEFLEQVPEERMRRQFSGDPLWSGSKEEED